MLSFSILEIMIYILYAIIGLNIITIAILLFRKISISQISLKDKHVIVTGAAGGIGSEVVKKLLLEGAIVHATDLKLRSLQQAFPLPEFQGLLKDSLFLYEMDVTQQEQINKVLQTIHDVHQISDVGLFGLVNNAGIAYSPHHQTLKLACEMDMEKDVLPVIQVNLLGCMRMVASCISLLKSATCKTSPIILNVASVAGKIALPFGGAYSTTKFALVGYSDTLRKEFSTIQTNGSGQLSINSEGNVKVGAIRVCCIEPTFVDTPLVHNVERQTIDRNSSLFFEVAEDYRRCLKNLIGEDCKEDGKRHPQLKADEVALAIVREMKSLPCRRHVIITEGWISWIMFNVLFLLPLGVAEWLEAIYLRK